MADPQIGQGFNQDIAYRYKPGQTQAEFYSQKTGQTFGDPNSLASYINTNYQGANATADNVFGVLAGGYTPRSQALDQIKTNLNSYQDGLYGTTDAGNVRKSSSITDSIAGEQNNYDTYLNEYNDLKKKLEALSAPNYQQAYNDLYNQQGIPQLNADIAANQKATRELPYVNRMNSGNAGIETEGQLSADTTQKGIPLEIQQANLLDRLKLAQDFINNSLKFKEMDTNASRQSLTDALNTVAETLNMSRTHLNDLLTQQKDQQALQEKAQQFAYDNRIVQPFYDIGGTVFRTSDQRAAHTPEEYVAMGGKGDFSDVQKLTKLATPIEVNPGNTLVDPITGKPLYQAQFTPSKYTTRGVGSSSSSSSSRSSSKKYSAPAATSEIMDEWKQGYIQGNGTISSIDYKRAKEWWISVGLSATSFDKQFGYLIDKSGKSWKSDYGYGAD